jgi:two-component sensor histidine kinase
VLPRGTGTSLSVRIVVLMVAAVLPLAALGASFAWVAGETAVRAEIRARYETARVFATLVETVIEGVSQVAAFNAGLEGLDDATRCSRMLARMLETLPIVEGAGIKVGSSLVCSVERGDGRSFSAEGSEWHDGAGIVVGPEGEAVLRIVRAISAEAPAVIVHVALPDIWRRLAGLAGFSESDVFLLTENGGIIGDPDGAIEPGKISAVAGALVQGPDPSMPVVAVDSDEVGFVAFARVGETSLRVAVTSDEAPVANASGARLVVVLLLPLLFLAAAVATAWFGVDRLVNRWIRRLRRTAGLYGAGRLSARVGPIEQAPIELQSLARAFDDMALSIEQRSRDLERALTEREHFLRELHHRIKNNFQMIASLLSLQRRELREPIEPAIREAHDRVQALAAAYRVSYADADTNAVPVAALMVELLERLRESAGAPASSLRVSDQTAGIVLHLDRAIPLALLTTELVAPMLDLVRQHPNDVLSVMTRVSPGEMQAIDVVIATTGTELSENRRAGLSSRLVTAYLAQLGADLQRSPVLLSLSMPVEAAHAPVKAPAPVAG